MKKAKPFLVNAHPNYQFAELARMPETQLVMLVPYRAWVRLAEYIPAFEAVNLAGRFGADPGDYEWEYLKNPEGLRWWRRNAEGYESLFGMTVAVRRNDLVELYGMVEVDENSSYWSDVIPEEAATAMPTQSRLMARTRNIPEETALTEIYRDYFRERGMLTMLAGPNQPTCRQGTIREVERFRDAIQALLERASKANLPSETNRPALKR